MRRLILALMITVLVSTVMAGPASASGDVPKVANANLSPTGLTATVSVPGSPGNVLTGSPAPPAGNGTSGSGGGGGGTVFDPCAGFFATPVPQCLQGTFDSVGSFLQRNGFGLNNPILPAPPGPPAALGPGPAAGGAAPVIDPAVLAQQALANAAFPAIGIGTDPTNAMLLVKLPTWLWLGSGWRTVTASASAGGVTSTITALPKSVRYDMGDGGSVTCASAGVRYDPTRSFESQAAPACGYTYTRGSAGAPGARFTVTATLSWNVTWAAIGAPGGGSLGVTTRVGTTTASVGEIQVLNR